MPNIQPNQQIYNNPAATPQIQGANNSAQNQGQSVYVTSPMQTSTIYNYPQASVYNDPTKQAASGVNIYIYNPSAIGGPNTAYQYPQPVAQPAPVPSQAITPQQSQPVANTPIQQPVSTTRTKRVVELTDDYIKSVESYIRSNDESIRKAGIVDIIQRFEEDESRYDDPALTALLNIALQDPSGRNRILAMSVIASGGAHGDSKTIELLNNLQSSDEIFGQEAQMANKALLKAAQTKTTIPDYSAPSKEKDDDDKDLSDV